MEKEAFDKNLHSSYNKDCTAGSVPIVLAEQNGITMLSKNSIYSSVLNNNEYNYQSNQYYFNNNNNNSNKETFIQPTFINNNPVYYQQLMENKIKSNLGLYNAGQINSDSNKQNLSISSLSNGSLDSPSPPKQIYASSKDVSPSNNYSDYSPENIHDKEKSHNKDSTPNKKVKSTFPFGKCRVCNDKATGIHYGIATCEGCKGFFKRSTLKKEKYRCYFGNNCLLTPKNRNRCKACRFNKCLDVGMSIQGVKMGRIPKIEKEKALLSLKLNGDDASHKHRLNQANNHYDDEDEDEGSNEDNNDLEDYDADDGDDEHRVNNDHDEMTRAFSKTSVLNEAGDFNYNVKMLLAQTKAHTQNQNNNNEEKTEHSIKKIKNNEPVNIPAQSIDCQRPEIIDKNEVVLFENLTISNNRAESEEISQSSDTNNDNEFSETDENRVSLVSKKQSNYDTEIDIDKELINFTPGYKHISIYELLKMHKPLRSSNIVANCYHSNLKSPTKIDDSYQIISSLLSDKIYQIHIEHNDKVVKLQERAIRLLYQGVQDYDGHDSSIKEVWEGLLESIPQVVKNLIAFAREIPGLNELIQTDFNLIINNKVFDFFILRHAPLFINGESFMMLPNNIQYTRKWMNLVIGLEMTDDLFSFSTRFNKLGLTTKEMALLYPLVLTGNIYEGNFHDLITVQNLNEYYHRALLYEFDLNLRDDDFIRRVNELISELPKLNELQAARIGSLSPQC